MTEPAAVGVSQRLAGRVTTRLAAWVRLRWKPAVLTAIRPQLALLSLLATTPLVALLLSGSVADRNQVVETARLQAENLAVLGAEQQDDTLQDAVGLLRILARVAEVRSMAPGPCHALLRTVAAEQPRVAIITVAGPDGAAICSSMEERPSVSMADRAYFQTALAWQPGQSTASDFIISRVTGKPTMIAAVPIPDIVPGNPAMGVIAVSLDSDWFARMAGHLPNPATNLMQVVEARDGAVVARQVGGRSTMSDGTRDPRLAEAFRAHGRGNVSAPDADGVDRLTGFATLPGTDGRLLVSVGLSRSEVLAQANQRLAWDVAAAAAAAATAFALAWAVGNRALLQPVRRLAAVAARLGSGDLSMRAGRLPAAARELQALGATFDDMSARLQAREAEVSSIQATLASSEEHHRILSTNATDMITRFDAAFHRSYVSPACREVIGYEPEELIGQYPGGIVHPDDLDLVERTLNSALRAGRDTARVTYRAIRKDGREVWLESGGRRLQSGSGFVVVTRDVTIRKEMEQQLEEANRLLKGQAMQDPLTGLANRRHFDEMLGNEFRRVQRLQVALGIIMLDIDHFKAFNDTYGHPAGDACIKAVSAAIDSVLRRPGDLAARYGGEEFAVLMPGTDRGGAAGMAERIRSVVTGLALTHTGSPLGMVTVSVGAASIMPPVGFIGPAAFLEAADAALYEAKRAGRNTIRVATVVRPVSEIDTSPDDFGADLARFDQGS